MSVAVIISTKVFWKFVRRSGSAVCCLHFSDDYARVEPDQKVSIIDESPETEERGKFSF